MAKAKLAKQHTPREFNLKISEGEADFILGVCARIGGTNNSPRKYARRLAKALSKATGYTYRDTDASRLAGVNGHGEYITFRDYDGSPSIADSVGMTESIMKMVSEMHEQDRAARGGFNALDMERADPAYGNQLELPF